MLDLKEYEKLESISIVITQPLINSYSEASGDHNLIHLNTEFAESTSFGHIIAHGMLTLSLIDQMMTKIIGLRQEYLNQNSEELRL